MAQLLRLTAQLPQLLAQRLLRALRPPPAPRLPLRPSRRLLRPPSPLRRLPNRSTTRPLRNSPPIYSRLFACVAHGFDVVPVGIEHERAVIGRVVVLTQARRTVVLSACSHRRLVEGVDLRPAVGREGDMDQ